MQRERGEHQRSAMALNATEGTRTSGIVLHSPVFYDWIVWLALMGKERAFREGVLDLANLSDGEQILDVGCGTGSLAIAAKRRLGPNGVVYGVDASPQMIARAVRKANSAGMEVVFRNGLAESLPFPDAQFDAVLSTVMLHHLPRNARLQCVREIRRVLKPAGRVLAVDFEGTDKRSRGFISHLHRRHGHVSLRDLIALVNEADFRVVKSGAVGIRDLKFVLAAPACCG